MTDSFPGTSENFGWDHRGISEEEDKLASAKAGENVSDLAREFGLSRLRLYDWRDLCA